MFEFVDDWYLNTREFAFFVFVAVVVLVYTMYLVYQLGLGRGWSFVMGVAYTIGMVIISDLLSDRAKERGEDDG